MACLYFVHDGGAQMRKLFRVLEFGPAGQQVAHTHQSNVPFQFGYVFLVRFVGFGGARRCLFIVLKVVSFADIGKVIGSDQ